MTLLVPNQKTGKRSAGYNRWLMFPVLIILAAGLGWSIVLRQSKPPEVSVSLSSDDRPETLAGVRAPETAKRSAGGAVISTKDLEVLKKRRESLPAELRFDAAELSERISSADVVVRNRALERFKNQLRARETSDPVLDSLAVLLRDVDPAGDAFASLVAAAGAVSVQAVQTVFLDLLNERSGDWKMFSAIVPVLGGVTYPLQETLDYLSQKAREGDGDFSSTAALALGGNVYTMSQTQPARGEKILEHYIAVVSDQQSGVEDIKLALAVLGNSGLVNAAGPILSLTTHFRTDVRAEAVMALRFMGTPEVERRLLQILESDDHLDVRVGVIDALVHRPVDDDVMTVVRRILGERKNVPLVLREKSLDLIMHFVFTDEQAKEMRIWLLGLAESETEERFKKMLVDAAMQLVK